MLKLLPAPKFLPAGVPKVLPERVDVLPGLLDWLKALPFELPEVGPARVLPLSPVGPADLEVWALRLRMDVAPLIASGDRSPATRVEEALGAIPAVLVVGSTLRKSWVFGSRK